MGTLNLQPKPTGGRFLPELKFNYVGPWRVETASGRFKAMWVELMAY